MRTSARILTLASLPLVLLATTAAPAAAAPPQPVPGTPSCGGLYAAFNNNKYGPMLSPSGNPRANAGPGLAFGQNTGEMIRFLNNQFCS